MSGPAYTQAEDDHIVRIHRAGGRIPSIMAALPHRSKASISVRMVALRKAGKLARSQSARDDLPSIQFAPPVVLLDDDQLVDACLAEGGFPEAVVLQHKTVWVGPDGSQWRHYPAPSEQGRAA